MKERFYAGKQDLNRVCIRWSKDLYEKFNGGWLHTNLIFYYVISAELSVFHAVCEYIDA